MLLNLTISLTLKPIKMKKEKVAMLQAIKEFNTWCQKYRVGCMYKKQGELRQSSINEFDSSKFKKLIESKQWKTT